MPLVRIDVPESLSVARAAALSEAVHAALVAHAGVPVDDRFHVISRHEADGLVIDAGFLGIRRGAEAAIVAITFRKGRSDEAKRALYRAIVEGASAKAGMRPEDVMIVLAENTLIDWSFGMGVAQYAP
ncbi:MAG: tautomerase family protein [Hyphomicrobiales bacterium]